MRPSARRGAAVLCRAQAGAGADAAPSRRAALAGAAAALLVAAAPAALADAGAAAASPAAAQALTRYVDDEGFAISIPGDWGSGEGVLSGNSSFSGATGARRTLAWFPDDGSASANDVNVTITITNTSLEFTKLGSFGNVYSFGQNLVNSMDTSFFLRSKGKANSPDLQIAKLLDANERNDMYWVEYTVHKPALEEQPRHLLSAVSLGFNGRYNRLITVTAQCRESQVGQYKPLFTAMLRSFEPPKKMVL
ncbi:hypothetical protein MNEG_13135 [Monoraphidium neglectum]|uniref:PsbP C-terminal domain-containing protein n=1 Tax=Monoraphidium neglectum TaxID=145388 RepID=A0A0D2J4G3_9CHLO|nr:hypothetical protein MNEG_13135 [Monoraphidium neglectum]KIY94827.1 hypothetical protein MNEG_13135 [Monoraphidium neglectum]|eukprot:XP_013893847.1 hypothetical protein MNEG_13135 [Monoraphidium neglectum]